MANFLGCLFILIFGAVLFMLGIARMLWQMLTGQAPSQTAGASRARSGARGASSAGPHTRPSSSSPGDARHESKRGNSRQRRSGKIFQHDEGRYIDFEEV